MVKISELKLSKVRKEIPFVNGNGEKEKIVVYNATEETKDKVISIIEGHTSEDGELLIEPADMLMELFPILTNIEIDIDLIDEVVANPKKEFVLANSEILTIINEINMEMAIAQNLEYERLLLLSEQIKGMNMVAYLKERMNRMKKLNDFDPLNAKAYEERNRRELDEMEESYKKVHEIYEEAVKSDKTEAESDE